MIGPCGRAELTLGGISSRQVGVFERLAERKLVGKQVKGALLRFLL